VATLNKIESDLLKDLNEPTRINIMRISMYLEIVLLIIQFAKDKEIWKDGKVRIKLVHWLSIIALFRQILEKLKAS
jgi:hypothetical protein